MTPGADSAAGVGAAVAWPPLEEDRPGPLSGSRVLDLSAFAVGPWAAAQLAHLGADVIKVEPPHADGIRMVRPTKHGEPTTYTVCNLGKRSVALDLKSDQGRRRALALAAQADVVVENARAGVMDRLGMGYADVSALNPEVVYCSSSSFGDRGPMAAVGSTDPQGQAMSGFASLNGRADEQPQLLRYSALVDLTTAMYLVDAVIVGLLSRRRTGRGSHIRTSQLQAAVAAQKSRIAEYFASGSDPVRRGSGVAALVPSRAYRCLDGRYVAVSAHTDRHFSVMCRVIGIAPAATDARFVTNADRVANREACDDLIATQMATRPSNWWVSRLTRAGVPAAPFLTMPEAMDHLQIRANEFIVRLPHPVEGTMASGGLMWRFDRTPARMDRSCLPGDLDLDAGTDGVSP